MNKNKSINISLSTAFWKLENDKKCLEMLQKKSLVELKSSYGLLKSVDEVETKSRRIQVLSTGPTVDWIVAMFTLN